MQKQKLKLYLQRSQQVGFYLMISPHEKRGSCLQDGIVTFETAKHIGLPIPKNQNEVIELEIEFEVK